MLFLGLSGGIGAGKSTVSARLAHLGAVVLDADRMAREVVGPGTAGLAAVVERFGTGVLGADGSLDRAALGTIVFADPAARQDLERITHPLIQQLTSRRHTDAPREAIVVHDMPLLVEGGYAPDYHLAVVVDVAQDVRVERLVRDRGMTREGATARMAAQASDEQRYAVADVVLDNHGTSRQLLDQVDDLWHRRLTPYNDNLVAGRPVRRPDPVVIDPPDRRWPARARRTIARIERQVHRAVPGGEVVGVDHIGSTSVSGLAAKDVIDLQVRVTDLRVAQSAAFEDAMAAAGFVPAAGAAAGTRTELDTVHPWCPDTAQWRKVRFGGCDPAQVVQVHVRRDGAANAQLALLFRDWLAANPAEVAAYAAHKHQLARLHPGGTGPARGDYASAKEPWMAAAFDRARRWRHPDR